MDSDSLQQIKRVAKEAMEDVVAGKLQDIVEYKMAPLIQKINTMHDLCSNLSLNVSELKYQDVVKIKDNLEQIKKVLEKITGEKIRSNN